MSRIPVSAHRRRKSAGHAALESAFTIMPLFGLILAFISFGLNIFKWTTLQNAVREGSRYAITYQTDASGHQDQSIKNVVQTWSMGFVDASLTGTNQQIFVRYYDPSTTIAPANAISDPPPTGTAAGNSSGRIVVVSVENIPLTWVTPILFAGYNGYMTAPTFKLNLYAANMMGGLPFGVSAVPR
jgi:Flp pilus assembly protein TadG